MNWQAHQPIEFNGTTYGQKDVEFVKFMALPSRTIVPLGDCRLWQEYPDCTVERGSGWRLRNAHEVTYPIDSYADIHPRF